LLPDNLIVAHPQQHLSPKQLAAIVAQPKVRIPIHAVGG